MTKQPDQYRIAAGLVLSRLRWDFSLAGKRERSRIRTWRNRFYGDKAVILCNGPSLNRVDFGLLERSGVFTFGLNKINLLFERSTFRPSCIVGVNAFVIEQNQRFYNSTTIPLFLDLKAHQRGWVLPRGNVHFLPSIMPIGHFSGDITRGISQGYTVTYVALQIAFYMGFRRLALVGCDHSFATKGQANQTVMASENDPNHFDPEYFSGTDWWQLPDLVGSEFHYQLADLVYRQNGGKIVNATEGGLLELFERESLGEFLANA